MKAKREVLNEGKVLTEDIDIIEYIYNSGIDLDGGDEFLAILEDIISRAISIVDDRDNADLFEVIQDAMDDALIYNDDKWEIMKHYQSPSDANFDEAWESTSTDCLSILQAILNDRNDSEDDEEIEVDIEDEEE